MIAFAGAVGFRLQDAGSVLGTTGAGLVLAAGGLFFAKDDERLPSKSWVMGVLLLIVAQVVLLFPHIADLDDVKEALRSLKFLVPFGVVAFVLSRARPGPFQRSGGRLLRAVPAGAMVAGAVLVLLTLALTTTDEGPGWQILALKKQWITYDYDLAGLLAQTYKSATSIRPVFAVGGYAVYLLALISAIVAVGWVVRRSAFKLERTPWLPWLAVASGFITFYIYNDIYWGWMAVVLDSGNARWPAVAGLALQFAAMVSVLLMAIAVARGKKAWRELSLLQVAQLPIAGFNFLMMPDLEGGLIYLPGLALLMMGSQLLTWGCVGALLMAANENGAGRVDASERLRTRSETSLPA